MSQDDVMGTIQALAHEEHELREREGRGEISNPERDRCARSSCSWTNAGTFSGSVGLVGPQGLIQGKRTFVTSTAWSIISNSGPSVATGLDNPRRCNQKIEQRANCEKVAISS